MKYKSLLLDVDGTLVPVGPHTIPSERVQNSLESIRGDVHVSLVSGRPLAWLTETFTVLEITDPCVINGGSQIVDPKTHDILWEQAIEQKSFDAIASLIRERNITSYLINDNGVEYKNPEILKAEKPLAMQLCYFGSKEDSDDCVQEILKIPNVTAHKFYSWDKDRNYKQEIYITHKHASKQHAVRELTKLLSVDPSEMIAVGDSRNDMPLFEIAGLKIAMGNADDKLKHLADHIAPSVDDDGVAHVIEHFIHGNGVPNKTNANATITKFFKFFT
jgi:Cof subfamily protein (haloacid dehalogenase superfamily)